MNKIKYINIPNQLKIKMKYEHQRISIHLKNGDLYENIIVNNKLQICYIDMGLSNGKNDIVPIKIYFNKILNKKIFKMNDINRIKRRDRFLRNIGFTKWIKIK